MTTHHHIRTMCSWTAITVFGILGDQNIPYARPCTRDLGNVDNVDGDFVVYIDLRQNEGSENGHSLCLWACSDNVLIIHSNHNDDIGDVFEARVERCFTKAALESWMNKLRTTVTNLDAQRESFHELFGLNLKGVRYAAMAQAPCNDAALVCKLKPNL